MITVNPIRLVNVKPISFGKNNNNYNTYDNSSVGLMTLDKNSNNKINFEKDLFITQKADSVHSNPLKAIGYNVVKAYNILSTPKRSIQSDGYRHLPYMA